MIKMEHYLLGIIGVAIIAILVMGVRLPTRWNDGLRCLSI